MFERDRDVLVALFREEWRLHVRLFGGWRFAAFPLFVAGLVAAAGIGLSTTGTDPARVIAGLHVFVLAFGLYSGTAGFAGSDMLENVLGTVTPLLASVENLPLSPRRLLGAFLLKDAAFYGALFVCPMAIGSLPVVGLGPGTPGIALSLVASLWAVFVVGMTTTVLAIALRTRGAPGWAIALGAVAIGAVAWRTGVHGPVWDAIVPYGVPAGRAVLEAAAVLAGTTIVAVGALAVYDPGYAKPTRTATDRFTTVAEALPVADEGLVAKSLLDLARSSGGVFKPFVSAGILLALVGALVGVVEGVTGLRPSPGIFFGGVLGLSAFTTYNWLTQFDRVEAYLAYPIGVPAVFRAKRTAFVLVGTPTVALPYVAAVVWFGATPIDAAVGAVLLAGFSLYYYGLTVFIAGFDPNEFLFDVVRFSLFTAGVALPLVPTLVAGFVVVPPTPSIAVSLAVGGVVAGAIGLVLSSRAGPRWAKRYRSG